MFCQGDFIRFVPTHQLVKWIQLGEPQVSSNDPQCLAVGSLLGLEFRVHLSGSTPGTRIFEHFVTGPQDLIRQIAIVNPEAKTSMLQSVSHLTAFEQDWTVYLGLCKVGHCRITVCEPSLARTEVVEISPTLPFDVEQHPIASASTQHDLDDYLGSSWFQEVQPVIETLQDDGTDGGQQVIFLAVQSGYKTAISRRTTAGDGCRMILADRSNIVLATSMPQFMFAAFGPHETLRQETIFAAIENEVWDTVRTILIPHNTGKKMQFELDGSPTSVVQIFSDAAAGDTFASWRCCAMPEIASHSCWWSSSVLWTTTISPSRGELRAPH